jgi:DNA-binding IclR family transcriptional regulator
METTIVEKDQATEKAAGGVDAVDRALSILACFQEDDTSLSLHELSERSKLYKSTLLRLAASLERAHYLIRLPDKNFALGPAVMRLGNIYQRAFRLEQPVRPILRRLVEETGESASFYRREGKIRICLFREDTKHAIRDHIREGDVLPVGQGAAGHVLASFQNPPASPAEWAKLVASLPLKSFGERDSETAAISAPIFNGPRTLIGALALSGPITRFSEHRVEEMSRSLMIYAEQLTTTLGGRWL